MRPEPGKWTSEAYESLTAAGVVEKLPHISECELGEVETREKAHQSRLTELQRIGSLHGQQPVTGYDELNVQEIQNLLAEGDDKHLRARARLRAPCATGVTACYTPPTRHSASPNTAPGGTEPDRREPVVDRRERPPGRAKGSLM